MACSLHLCGAVSIDDEPGRINMTLKTHLGRRSAIADAFVDAGDPLLTTLFLGKAVDSDRLYASIDVLQPGAKSCKFHSHSEQEEFFYILKGSCTLRFGDETTTVQSGDFISKPAGRGIAHQFINDSDDIVELLDIGLKSGSDRIFYPDEGVTYEPAKKAVRDQAGNPLTDWTSGANVTEG
jgi:uncharacterized cupin superfamily protein